MLLSHFASIQNTAQGMCHGAERLLSHSRQSENEDVTKTAQTLAEKFLQR